MRFTSLAPAIDAIETQMAAVTDALLTGDATSLQGHCETLRQISIDFSQFLATVPAAERSAADVSTRLVLIGRKLGMQRESLARRAFVIDRQVACLVPAKTSATYGPSAAAPGRGAAVARIYATRAN